MSHFSYNIAFLSTSEDVYQELRVLFQQTKITTFSLTWIDLSQSLLLQELPPFDAYLSDAPLLYLVSHNTFIAQRPFFWITDADAARHEILELGVLDCFLMTELTSSLLEHSLRIYLRHTTPVEKQQNALTEFEGDRFQTLIKNIPGAVYRCLHSETWQGMYISDAIEKIVGYPAADFAPGGDRNFSCFIHPADVEFVNQVVEDKIQEKKSFALEYRLVHRDGSIKWVDERGQGVFDGAGNLLWIDGVIIDVSEKKAIAQALAQRASDYYECYEKTPAMMHSIDAEGKIIAVSDRWLKKLGYERTEVIGRKSIDFLTEQSRQYAVNVNLPRMYERGYNEDLEYQFVKKNGEAIDVLLSIAADHSSGRSRYLAVLVDVTAQNQLARKLDRYQNRLQSLVIQGTQSLANTESRLRTIFDVAPMGIIEVDWNGNYRLANRKYTEIVGCDLDTLLTKRIQDFTYPEDLDISLHSMEQLKSGEISIYSIDKRYQRSDGQVIWVHIEASAVRNAQGQLEYMIAMVDDINQRKLMEESLRKSEHRLAQAQTIAHIGSWEWDIRANTTYWSDQTYAHFGVEIGSIAPNSETFFQLLHPDDVAKTQDNIQRMFAGESLPYSEYRIITPAGEVRVLQDYHELIRDEQGEPIYIAGATQDITELRQTMSALQASEARLAKAQKMAHVGIWEWNIAANRTYWSAEVFDVFGLQPNSIQPNYDVFMNAVHPDDRALVSATIQRAVETGESYNFEYRLLFADGTIKYCLEYGEAVRDQSGQITHLAGTTQDVTVLKQTMIALQASETRLAKSQAIAHVGSWQWDLTTDKLIWSDENFRIFDLEPRSLEPTADLVFSMVYPEDLPLLEAAIPILQAGEKVRSMEYRIITPQGQHKIVVENAEPLLNEAGEVTHFSGTLQDITAFKQTMSALQASEAHLAKSQAIAHVGSWEWNFKTNTLNWSDEFYRILDFEPQSVIATFETFINMVELGDRPIIEGAIERLKTGEIITDLEYCIITATGRRKTVLDHVITPQQNEQGELVYLSGAMQDITDLKNNLIALQESETRLAKSQAIAHVGSWEWNFNTNKLSWSDEMFRLCDLEPQSVEPTYEMFLSKVEPSDVPKIEALMAKVYAGETISEVEYRLISAQGGHKTLLAIAESHCNSDGVVEYVTGSAQDITDFKQTMLALQDSETRFRELVEHIDESFWINSADPTKVIYVSPAYEKIWGRTCESLLADGDSWLESVHPDDRDRQVEALTNMVAGKGFNEKYRIVRLDGTVRWIHARAFKIHDKNGTLVRHVGAVTDITELKEIELELRASESRFRSMFDQAALGIAQIHLNSQFHLVNQAFCDLVGYTHAELSQMTWQELTHPDDLGKCAPGFAEISSRAAKSFLVEKRYVHKHGHEVWVKAIASFIYDENDQPKYLLGLVEDITKYKQAAIALAESQSRYQELVEGMPAIIYQFSLKQGGIFYSSQLRQILGYEPEFLLQHPLLWHDSIHPEDVQNVDKMLKTLQVGKNFAVEYRIQDAAGNWHWFYDCSFSINQLGEDLVIDGFALDITERKQFDLTLRHRLSLETVLAEISHLMVVEADLDFTEVLKLLGETFKADRMSVMEYVPNTTLVKRLAAWAATDELALDLEQIDLAAYPWWLQHWEEQRRILIDRNHPLPESAVDELRFLEELNLAAVMWMPIQDHQGHPWGYIECSSIQENHLLWSKEDTDLMAIAGELIYNYGDRQKSRHQLEAAKEAAEAANHAKNQFLTNMSHELRTPLNAVLGFTQLMEASKTLPENHRKHLGIVRRSGKHLLTLLNDILNLAKFEKGLLQLNPSLFDLHVLLEDLQHIYTSEAERKHLQWSVQWDQSIPRYIIADQAKLHSVLTHLLSNALKFTNTGSVTLIVQAIAQDPLKLEFRVIDTGIGIPEDDLTKLFDNFVKLEAGDRLGQGSGLGLALSQKLMHLMGSEIKVSSSLGTGSCFAFELTCKTTNQFLNTPSANQETLSDYSVNLTPDDLSDLPETWRETFYKAALSARSKQLEELITELPPDTEIFKTLNLLLNKLEFEKLASLSKPSMEVKRQKAKGKRQKPYF